MKKRTKKILSVISGTFLSAATLFTLAVPVTHTAHAGGAGGGDGGSAGTGAWWRSYGAPGTQQAWNNFYANGMSTWPWSDLAKQVVQAGNKYGNPNLLSQCKNSRYIWYYGDLSGPNYWYNQGSYTNNAIWAQGRPPAAEWKDFMSFDGGHWAQGNTVLICSGTYEDLEKDCSYDDEKTETNDTVISGAYSANTIVNPVATQEFNSYSDDRRKEWLGTHEVQQVPEQISNYGKWYNDNIDNIKSLDKLTGAAYEAKKAEIEAGAKKAMQGDYIPHPNIELSDKNKNGFARGGVFNVVERQRQGKITIGQKTVKKRHVACKMKMQANGQWGPKQETPGTWSEKAVGSSKPTTQQLNSPVAVSFWQMIHAKCNQAGMGQVQTDVPGIKDESGNTNTASTTLHTNTYSRQSDLPLGDPNGKTETLKETSSDVFYNKTDDCVPLIDCISDPTAGPNDAKNNVQNTGAMNNNTFGAQSKAVIDSDKEQQLSSDSFTFFRDNQDHNVRMDLWYPVVNNANSGIVTDTNKALFTRFIFDPNGTPAENLLSVKIKDKQILNGTDIAKSKGYVSAGEVTNLLLASQWASKEGAPHRLNADWVTEPTVSNTVYTEVNGTGSATKPEITTSKIRVYCSMNVNTKDIQKPVIDADTSDLNPVKPLDKFNPEVNKSVSIDFIRAGSGLNQNK